MKKINETSLVSRTLKLLIIGLAIFATTMAGTQAASASAPAPQVAVAQAAAPAADLPYYVVCSAPTYYSNGVTRYCDVYSGYVRQYVSCSNGYTYFGPWVGVGYWYLYNYCPSGYYRTGSGLQFTG